jgi:hypothetical protein
LALLSYKLVLVKQIHHLQLVQLWEDYALIPTQNTYSGTANAVTGGVQYNF